MKRVLIASTAAASLFWAGLALAQPGGFGGGPGGGPGGNIGFLLQNDQIQEELKIDDAQAEEVQDLVDAQRDAMREMFRGGDFDFRSEEGRAKIREMVEEQTAKLEKDLGTVLKPEQITRLKQIGRQMQTNRPGQSGGLIQNERLTEELGLTEAQLTEMRKKAPEVQEELRAEIQKATKAAEEKLLSVLTPTQKAKYAELMGEPFQFDPARGGFGGRGQGGNRGQGGGTRGGNNGGNRDNEPLPEL
jgi:Spy/CpxP family protein refolding chaperone